MIRLSSLYLRIGLGFILLLALMLAAQAGLFLWLAVRSEGALPPRMLADFADLVADEIEAEAARTPGLDLEQYARTRFPELHRPVVLVLSDGRLIAEQGAALPPPVAEWAVARVRQAAAEAPPAGSPRGPGRRGARRGRRIDGPGRLPVAFAPVVVDRRVVAAVVVTPLRPFGRVMEQFAPLIGLGALLLLVGGTALAALIVFRPAHARLRALQEAADRLGAGDASARAPDEGGDEIASVARSFNRMAGELAARQAALVDADRARRQLLADVSHELMTPLTAIRGYAETLSLPQFAPPGDAGRYVGIVIEEVDRIERLVGDLLDLARYEAGGAALASEPLAVADLFARVRARHQPVMRERGIDLHDHIAADAAVVVGDARRLEQALQNLAANALRHSGPGGRVSLSATRRGASVVLAVADTGTGIAPEHLPHVFDRFYKADPSRADGGTGLGLSIVRAIVEQHGGTVTARSTPGVETVFEVVLPGGA
ncbi:MAG: HAMP domain-containing sensor histidine kinase [Vicinamibacterales bacterium]|nr:HAMP domain-containing sensor histidine kinase [Vicinamibacterales bacterium]